MNRKPFEFRYLVVSFFGLLAACSGSVNVDIKGPDIWTGSLPWIDEAVTAHGVNTGMGGITVNGVTYLTGHTTVWANGRPGTVSGLRRGQVITVRGQIHGGSFTGTADRIDYDARLIGPVESLDADNHRLAAMGQTVITGPKTVFAGGINPANYAGLNSGSVVEISGFARADGTILATWIELVAGNPERQLIGEVKDHDLANLTYSVGGLTVDYGTALVIDLPGGAPADGMIVKMTGELRDGRFIVETVVTAPDLSGFLGRHVQAAGLVTDFNSRSDFDVNGHTVTTNSNTVFVNGGGGDVALNAEIVIDGRFASNGSITANRITFRQILE